MKRKGNHFKVICGFFLCAVILTGCSGGHQAAEEISVEDGREERKKQKRGIGRQSRRALL